MTHPPPPAGRALTLRPRFLIGVTVVLALASVVALLAGAGFVGLAPAGLALVAGVAARARFRLDDQGVGYRGAFGGSFSLPWSEISQVVVDVIRTSSPGQPSAPVARVRLVRVNGPPVTASLFSRRDRERVVEAVRARGVELLDERERG